MANYDFDVICVGCGHGCDLAARILARAGKKVAAVECDLWFAASIVYSVSSACINS